jgi:hypothetical protein
MNSSRHCTEIVVSEKGKRCSSCLQPNNCQYSSYLWTVSKPTLSLSIVQISEDPEFVTGMTLMSLASSTLLADVEVKSDFRLTFHFVHNQVKLCAVMIVPHHTNVHSEPLICFVYNSSER